MATIAPAKKPAAKPKKKIGHRFRMNKKSSTDDFFYGIRTQKS